MKSLDGKVRNLMEAKIKGYLKSVFSAGPTAVRINCGGAGIQVECSGVLNKYERNLVDLLKMESSVVALRQEVFRSTCGDLEKELERIIQSEISGSKLMMDTRNNRCNILLDC